MLILILILVVGSGLVYISRFNYMPVSINLGPYMVSDVPLFYVIVGSLLSGLLISYLAYLIHAISTSFKLKGKDSEIKQKNEEVLELTKRVHQLELEKEKIKVESNNEPVDPNAL